MSSQTRRYAGKVRYGRGFTLAELRGAGLSAAFARTVGISVDHRRTSTSEEQLQLNINRLNDYKNKLVLFPRREGQPKKGQVNDATAEQVKKAGSAAATPGITLPRAVAKPTVTFDSISKTDKDYQARATLRIARTTAKYTGRREKRARDAAEKEK